MRYFLIDRITEVVPGVSIRGVKNVTLSDETVHDHFPDLPVFPAALLVEAAAQLAGALLEFTVNGNGNGAAPLRALLVQVDRAKFLRLIEPGDQIRLEARLDSRLETTARVSAEARVDGEVAGRMVLTFVLREVPWERIHEQRRRLYRLWTRNLPEAPVIR